MRLDELAPGAFPEGIEEFVRRAKEDPIGQLEAICLEMFLACEPWSAFQKAIIQNEARAVEIERPETITGPSSEEYARRWIDALTARVSLKALRRRPR